MDGGSWLLAILFVSFVIGGAYFAGSESAFSSMNRIRIKSKADDGERRAKNAMFIANNFDRALTTLLVGNNVTHIAAASVATLLMTRIAEKSGFIDLTSDQLTVYCTVITTVIVFLFSEMIPKSLSNDRSETMALFSANFLRFLMKILYPIVAFFTLITSYFTRLFGREIAPTITEDELYDIIDTAEEEGVMGEEQSDLLKSALDFSGTTAGNVMTMREDIIAVNESLSNEELIAFLKNSNHSRIPVYRESLDNITGVLNIREFFKAYLKDKNADKRRMIHKPYFVGEDEKIDDLLTRMSQHKVYIAIVRDESRKTVGLVTMEDFLEELVGEIWDEDDVVDDTFQKLGGNRFLVNTKLRVGEVFSKMKYACDDRVTMLKPVQTWILEQFGHLPEEEDTFLYLNIEVTIDEIEENRVTKAVFRILDEDELAELKAENDKYNDKEKNGESTEINSDTEGKGDNE